MGLYFAELDGILKGSVSVVSKATTYIGEYLVALSRPEAIPLTAQEKKRIGEINVFCGPKVSNSRKAFDELPVEERERLLTALLASSAEGAVIEDIVPVDRVTGYQEALKAAEQYRVPLSEVGQRFRELEIELAESKTAYKATFPDITVFNGTLPEHLKGCLPFELKSRTDRVLMRLSSEAFHGGLRRQQLAATALPT